MSVAMGRRLRSRQTGRFSGRRCTMYNGLLYVAYAAYADTDPYHGWILGFDPIDAQHRQHIQHDAQSRLEFAGHSRRRRRNLAIGRGAGIGRERTCTSRSGNGDYDPTSGLQRLGPEDRHRRQHAGSTEHQRLGHWHVADYFTPYNEQQLADADADLGSAGAIVLPDQPGRIPHEIATIGKQGIIYLLDRDNLGQYNGDDRQRDSEGEPGQRVLGQPSVLQLVALLPRGQ